MKKRILASILAGAMIVSSIMPIGINTVQAQQSILEQIKNVEATDTVTYINPLYEGLISEKDLTRIPENGIAVYSEPKYETDDNIIAGQIRKSMINREETINIYYQSNQSYNENRLKNWVQMAFDETGDSHGGDYLRWSYGGYKANISYSTISGVTNYTYTITVTYYTTSSQEAALDSKLSSVLTSLGVKSPELSDYEKIKRIYDYICDNVTYDYDNLKTETYLLKYTAYAALINKTAVCQGYATLLYRMLKDSGIDTRVITGDGGGPHAWNIIKLGDLYYLADSTWDAGRKNYGYNYFLKGTGDFGDHTAESDFLESYKISNKSYNIADMENHTHNYSTEWSTNEENHWHKCACGSKTAIASHTESGWIVDKAATAAEAGSRYRKCTVCSKILKTEALPKLEQTSASNKTENNTKPDNTAQVNESNNSITKVKGIKLTGMSKKIAAGKKIKLTATVAPSNASKKVIWKSSNVKVATVNKSGTVTMKKDSGGKSVTITATATDGSGVKASYKITSMKGVVKKITISGKNTVKAGKSLKLKAKVTSSSKANKQLKWESNNTKYAKVSNSGKITTYKAGKGKKVKITAMATDGSGKKNTITIKIK